MADRDPRHSRLEGQGQEAGPLEPLSQQGALPRVWCTVVEPRGMLCDLISFNIH